MINNNEIIIALILFVIFILFLIFSDSIGKFFESDKWAEPKSKALKPSPLLDCL